MTLAASAEVVLAASAEEPPVETDFSDSEEVVDLEDSVEVVDWVDSEDSDSEESAV